MGIFDWLLKRQDTDQKYMLSSIGFMQSSARGQSPAFSMQRSVASYQSWVYAAATINAQAVASVPLRLYVRADAQGE